MEGATRNVKHLLYLLFAFIDFMQEYVSYILLRILNATMLASIFETLILFENLSTWYNEGKKEYACISQLV